MGWYGLTGKLTAVPGKGGELIGQVRPILAIPPEGTRQHPVGGRGLPPS